MDKSKIAVDIFNKHAKAYQDKFMNLELYHHSFDLFCDSIKKKDAEILEVACGPGNITKYLLQKRPDLKILGTDLAPNMIALAAINNPTARFELMDARRIDQLSKKYDAIMCGFCFPYFSKEEALKFISDTSGRLNENGVLYISTMEDDYSKSAFKKGSAGDEIFMHYHQADYLTNSLKENGFSILGLKRQDYPESDGTNTTDLILIAKKS